MNIARLIELLPDQLKSITIDFQDVVSVKNHYNGIRVMFERELTEEEKEQLLKIDARRKRKIVGSIGTANYKYAPEIKHGYVTIITERF